MATNNTPKSLADTLSGFQAREADERQRDLLPTKKAAKYIGMSPAFLERDRWDGKRNGHGPQIPYVVIGKRAKRYRRSDLDAYIEKNVVT